LVTAAALIVAGCVLGVVAFALWPLVGLRPLWCKAPPLLRGVALGGKAPPRKLVALQRAMSEPVDVYVTAAAGDDRCGFIPHVAST
jgi:hypothetical protein